MDHAHNVIVADERRHFCGVGNVDAFVHYQKAWKLYLDAHGDTKLGLLEGLRLANAEFDHAIALEPNYAMAHYAKAAYDIDCEDTITLTVQWENVAPVEGGAEGEVRVTGAGTAVYTSSWVAPKSDVHSQQRFFYMGQVSSV